MTETRRTCTHHCGSCGSCFTSLRAFDAHRSGPAGARECSFPDDAQLVEIAGVCRIADPSVPPRITTIYEHEDAQALRGVYRNALNGRETAERKLKSGVAA